MRDFTTVLFVLSFASLVGGFSAAATAETNEECNGRCDREYQNCIDRPVCLRNPQCQNQCGWDRAVCIEHCPPALAKPKTPVRPKPKARPPAKPRK